MGDFVSPKMKNDQNCYGERQIEKSIINMLCGEYSFVHGQMTTCNQSQ